MRWSTLVLLKGSNLTVSGLRTLCYSHGVLASRCNIVSTKVLFRVSLSLTMSNRSGVWGNGASPAVENGERTEIKCSSRQRGWPASGRHGVLTSSHLCYLPFCRQGSLSWRMQLISPVSWQAFLFRNSASVLAKSQRQPAIY